MSYTVRWYLPNSVMFVEYWGISDFDDAIRFLKDRVDVDWSQASFDNPFLIERDNEKT